MTIQIRGERIKQLRHDFGWTQQELSNQIAIQTSVKIAQSHVANMETGGKLASLTVLHALARTLDTNMEYLLGFTDNPLSIQDIERDIEDRDGIAGKLKILASVMPEDKRRTLLSIAELFAYGDRDAMGTILRTVAEIGGQQMLMEVIDALDTLWPNVSSYTGAKARMNLDR